MKKTAVVGILIGLIILSGCQTTDISDINELGFTSKVHKSETCGVVHSNKIINTTWTEQELTITGEVNINDDYNISGAYYEIDNNTLTITITTQPTHIMGDIPAYALCSSLHDFTLSLKNIDKNDYNIKLNIKNCNSCIN